MRDGIKTVIEFIKFVMEDKYFKYYAVLVVVSFSVWVYMLIVRHSVIDVFLQPLAAYVGYRLGAYGLLGLLPGGKWLSRWLSEHYYDTIKYEFKSWYWYFRFIKENTFTLDYMYISKEMFKGDTTSVRETTGVGVVTFGFGTRQYIFNLQ